MQDGARLRIACLAGAVALALVGCPGPGLAPAGPGKSRAPGKASPTPGVRATATPGAPVTLLTGPSASPSAAGPVAALPTSRLSGTVALDRAYVLGADGGGFISDQGGGLVAKGGQVVANNGGSLLAADPAGILSNHAAGLIANNGGGLTGKVKLISDKGGALMTVGNSGTLIANNGAGLISDKGGGLVSNNGGGYRLAQAAGPAPVGGMLVAAYSLALGGYLPLGKDQAGNPVYATYTDRDGKFDFQVPQAAGTNVMIVASAPGAGDRRLAVDLVVPTQGGTAARVDARTTVVSAFLRRSAEGWLEENLGADPCRPAPDNLSGLVLANVAAVTQTFDVPAFKALAPAGKRFVIARMVEQALAAVSLTDLTIVEGMVPGVTASGPALPVLEAILGKLEAAAAARLATDPRYFDKKQYVLAANLRRRADRQLAIRTPADIGGFIVEVYMATADTQVQRSLDRLLLDLGLDVAIRDEMRLAGASVLQKLMPAFAADETRARAQAFIAEAALDAQGLPADPPCPTLPPLPWDVDVTTIAGGPKGFRDGPGATARFTGPVRLAVDAANRLIVAEGDGRRLRAIDLADPTHPVRTIAGSGADGDADGPALAAAFREPWGLALGGPGELFVADAGGHRIRRVTGYDGAAAAVATVAGSGVAGFADGAAASAQLNFPVALARGGDGLLYVVDEKNQRIRRIKADGAVETVAGSGADRSEDGLPLAAAFNNLRGAAFGPDGALYVAEAGDDKIRRWTPDGVTTYAGSADPGADDGASDRATLAGPSDLAWLADGSLVFADARSHRIRLLDPAGHVFTIAGGGAWGEGSPPGPGVDGPGATARFNRPIGLAVGPDGTIYVADKSNHRIRAIRLRKRG